MVSASNIHKYLLASISLSSLILFWFVSSVPSDLRRSPLFIISMTHFPKANSTPISWLYILPVLGFLILFRFWQTVWCRQCTKIWWLIFCFRFMKFVSECELLFFSFRVFHISVRWWSFNGSLIDSKSPQVSRTLLSILADLKNVVVWIVWIRPLISYSSSPLSKLLTTVQSRLSN